MVDLQKQLKRKWLFTGGFGAVFLGAGISGAIESGFLKHEGALLWQWVLAGTVSLAFVILGVVLLIKAAFLEYQMKQ